MPDSTSLDSSCDNFGDLKGCLERVRSGDVYAISQLYDRYLERSVRLAKSRLKVGEGRLIDDEQAAMSALESLIVRVRGGSYADIEDHLALWNLLARIILRKLSKYRRNVYGPTRSPVLPILPVNDLTGDDSGEVYRPVVDQEPSPIAAAMAKETLEQVLEQLAQSEARSVLLLRLEGYSDGEIAEQLGRSRNWVRRRITDVRRVAKSLLRDES